MGVTDLKTWHWVFIGVLAGTAFGGVRLWSRGDWMESPARTIGQEDFENGLTRTTASGHAMLERIVVHPPERAEQQTAAHPQANVQWVTAVYTQALNIHADLHDGFSPMVLAELTAPVKFPAAIPYVGLDGKARQDGIRQYFDEIAAAHGNAGIGYQYAWYEMPAVEMALWICGSTALIGGLWPVVLGVLVGAGFGPQPEPPLLDLSKFHSDPRYDAKKANAAAVADCEMLLALIETNERRLGEGASAEASAAGASVAKPPAGIRRFGTTPVAPAASKAEGVKKDFAGEFYPTETHGKKMDNG